MTDWNPALYLHYNAERTRPAVELLSRVALNEVTDVVDLGCGPGNSTALLQQRWPSARITGIDTSPAMLAEARAALPGCRFVEADIRHFRPDHALSVIYANASLQWVENHYELLPHLVSDLNESEQQRYLHRYHQLLEEQYPLQENGQILLAFPRLFIVARREP